MLFRFRWMLIGMVLTLGINPARAMFIYPQLAPVDRLLAKAQAYMDKHPQEADAHYTLARIHYLAFSDQRDEIRAYRPDDEKEEKPNLIVNWMRDANRPGSTHGKLPPPSLIDHASKARKEFEEAMRLDAQNGLYALGLASLLDEIRQWKWTAHVDVLPDALKETTLSQVRGAYAKAMALSLPEDEAQKTLPMSGLKELVSYEAAEALVRLSEEKNLIGGEEHDLQEAKKAIAQLQQLPPCGVITPVVFSFQQTTHLSERLSPEIIVDFDLRGYGWRQRWTWVKPSLGLLVWDPKHSGKITSARQLFGSYTFQIFRKNGYDALAALDDNGDGVLSRAELEGISVWFNQNSDGISQPGEVTSVQDLNIRSIATAATGTDGIHPMNRQGLVFQDGRILPTWDWITRPVNERSPLSLAASPSVRNSVNSVLIP